MGAILDALRALGGSAPSTGVYDYLKAQGIARVIDLETRQISGELRFVKEVRFARKELVDAGLLLGRSKGIWELSAQGQSTLLSPAAARELVRLRRHRPSSGGPPDHTSQLPIPIGPTMGPPPTSWSGEVSRSAVGPAWTYIMRYAETDIWKVGFSTNLPLRLIEINAHLPHEITGQMWSIFKNKRCATPQLAFRLEQRLLVSLHKFRTSRERLCCTQRTLLSAWKRAVALADE